MDIALVEKYESLGVKAVAPPSDEIPELHDHPDTSIHVITAMDNQDESLPPLIIQDDVEQPDIPDPYTEEEDESEEPDEELVQVRRRHKNQQTKRAKVKAVGPSAEHRLRYYNVPHATAEDQPRLLNKIDYVAARKQGVFRKGEQLYRQDPHKGLIKIVGQCERQKIYTRVPVDVNPGFWWKFFSRMFTTTETTALNDAGALPETLEVQPVQQRTFRVLGHTFTASRGRSKRVNLMVEAGFVSVRWGWVFTDLLDVLNTSDQIAAISVFNSDGTTPLHISQYIARVLTTGNGYKDFVRDSLEIVEDTISYVYQVRLLACLRSSLAVPRGGKVGPLFHQGPRTVME